MAYRLRGLGALLRTPLGRRHLRYALCDRSTPLALAVAAVYRWLFLRRTRIVAIVGSYGKTTAARTVVSALGGSPADLTRANSGGWVALALLRMAPWRRHGVVEVGINGPGQMARYARAIRPDVTVVMSVGSEHRRSLKDLATTRDEKAWMVRALPASGLAVLNGDDPNVAWMAGETRARVITFGVEAGRDIRATSVASAWPDGTRIELETALGARALKVRLVGWPMVYPVLAAVAVAVGEGRDLDRALAAIEAVPPTPGRLEPVPLATGAVLLRDEFKSTVETIDAALDVLDQLPASRRIVVMGDVTEPGPAQRQVYRRLGERAGRIVSGAIVLSEGDSGAAFRAGARKGGLPEDRLAMVGRSVRRATDALSDALTPGTVVLLKGRDTQRLERVALALMGRDVRCELVYCNARLTRCDACPMLGRAWPGLWRTDRPTRPVAPEGA